MADDPQRIKEPPYPPPSAMAVATVLTTSSLLLMAGGAASLLMWLLVDCLSKFHLLLGGVEFLVGLAIFIWFLSWWLPSCRRGLREYEVYLEHRHAELAKQIEQTGNG